MKTFSIGSIIWLILAILSFILNVYVTLMAPKSMEYMRNMIEIEDARLKPENDGKLVLVNGKIETEEDFLKDPMFNISVHTPILIRDVQMLQWYESESTEEIRNSDGDLVDRKVYEYEKMWANYLIKSGSFRESYSHKNPVSMPYESKTFKGTVHIGDFYLSEKHMELIRKKAKIAVTELSDDIAERYNLRVDEKCYTNVNKGDSAKIGDIRISFFYVDPDILSEATIFAKQNGNTFVESGPYNEFWFEKKDKEQVLTEREKSNKILIIFSWCWTVFCILMMMNLIRMKRAEQKKYIPQPALNENVTTDNDDAYDKEEGSILDQSVSNESHTAHDDSSSGCIISGKFANSLMVEDVFMIPGRGCVVTGKISDGSFSVGDQVEILHEDTSIDITEIEGIEMLRKVYNTANKGDNVGIMLKDITKDDVVKGDVIRK